MSTQTVCCFCKKINHVPSRCRYRRKCKYCPRDDHLSSQCSRRKPQDYKGCIICMTTLHETDDCTKEKPINPMHCIYCLRDDHLTKHCPNRHNPRVSDLAYARFDKNSCDAEDFFRENEQYY